MVGEGRPHAHRNQPVTDLLVHPQHVQDRVDRAVRAVRALGGFALAELALDAVVGEVRLDRTVLGQALGDPGVAPRHGAGCQVVVGPLDGSGQPAGEERVELGVGLQAERRGRVQVREGDVVPDEREVLPGRAVRVRGGDDHGGLVDPASLELSGRLGEQSARDAAEVGDHQHHLLVSPLEHDRAGLEPGVLSLGASVRPDVAHREVAGRRSDVRPAHTDAQLAGLGPGGPRRRHQGCGQGRAARDQYGEHERDDAGGHAWATILQPDRLCRAPLRRLSGAIHTGLDGLVQIGHSVEAPTYDT